MISRVLLMKQSNAEALRDLLIEAREAAESKHDFDTSPLGEVLIALGGGGHV